MSSVPLAGAPVQPTNAAPLPRLFAYTTSLGLERFLGRRKRGLSTPVRSLAWLGQHGRCLRGYRLYLAVDTDTGQVLTFVLLRGDARDHRLTAVLARRVRRLLGRRLAGVVADSGFTSHAAVRALLQARIPFILGFARSGRIRTR